MKHELTYTFRKRKFLAHSKKTRLTLTDNSPRLTQKTVNSSSSCHLGATTSCLRLTAGNGGKNKLTRPPPVCGNLLPFETTSIIKKKKEKKNKK